MSIETSEEKSEIMEQLEADNSQKNSVQTEVINKEEKVEEGSSEEKSTKSSNEENNTSLRWFIVKTTTGQEGKVSKALKDRIVNLGKSKFFEDIVVPEETVITNAGGKKRRIKKKFFPGYILVRMVLNNETWQLVKSTDKIIGFVGGTPNNPLPISDQEASSMINQDDENIKKVKTAGMKFYEGEKVKVIEGPFSSFIGTIEQVSDKKVKVNVSIFGRPTPVELEYSQVEKIS